MAKRLAIPQILGMSWWWLFVIGFFEFALRYLLHIPAWVPNFFEFWFLGQAFWLRAVEPNSRSLYLYVAVVLGWVALDALPSFKSNHMLLYGGFTLGLMGAFIAASFLYRAEMMLHFNETDPRDLTLTASMTFFFGYLYFQYWFHQLYIEQEQDNGRVMAI
jgi:hypothetical protein